MVKKEIVKAAIHKRKAAQAKECEDVIDLLLKMHGECQIKLFHFHSRGVQDLLEKIYTGKGWDVHFAFDEKTLVWGCVID